MRLTCLSVGALLLGVVSLQAQITAVDLPPVPRPNSYPQLKAYLNLSDAQLQSLLDIQKSRSDAQQAISKQISDKNTQLNALLNSGSTDAPRIGQLMLDIRTLQKQLPIPGSTYRSAALKVLAPDQTAKLAALVTALQLQPAAYQAVTLNLLDAPTPAPIVGPIKARMAAEPASEVTVTAPDQPDPPEQP